MTNGILNRDENGNRNGDGKHHQRLLAVLQRSIERAAAPGEVWYTRPQLYYEVCRSLRPVPGLRLSPALLVLAAGLLP
ncbi:MAG: hypothetical protein HC884_13815, partial [Chloroflexaceae bacterium]|nr:hypothetical protein [Chloroflexaceae bacterium]